MTDSGCLKITASEPAARSAAAVNQLYHAYAESHEHDPQEIGDGFKELEEYLCVLPLDNNNAVFNLCCRLCSAYERKATVIFAAYATCLINAYEIFPVNIPIK